MRKHAIRALSAKQAGRPRKSAAGRPALYREKALRDIVVRIWKAADYPCGKRLVAMLPLWLAHDEKRHGPYRPALRDNVARISAATLDRLLLPVRGALQLKGRCGTKPGSLLRTQIPIRMGPWDETEPGFVEADTVAHCGTSMAGNFIWSLTLTDIASTWTECRAVWNKGSMGIVSAIKAIEAKLPFGLKGFDCDNGTEFLNQYLVQYFTEHPKKPVFTRSRPYRKNDNAHVEQKNYSHVRQLFGYGRFENSDLVALMNDLYANEFSRLQNFFCPSVKLLCKERHGSKIIKRYDSPKTPAQRLLDSDHIAKSTKDLLHAQFQSLDPFELHARIQAKLKAISKLVSVTPILRQ